MGLSYVTHCVPRRQEVLARGSDAMASLEQQARSASIDVVALKGQAARLEQQLAAREHELDACKATLAQAASHKAELEQRAAALDRDVRSLLSRRTEEAEDTQQAAALALRSLACDADADVPARVLRVPPLHRLRASVRCCFGEADLGLRDLRRSPAVPSGGRRAGL